MEAETEHCDKMAVARKYIDKNVLMNVIRHTDAHNKIQEEREMWRAYEQRNSPRSQNESPIIRRFDGKMRCDDAPRSTQCMTELYNFEANDSERWGHGGYRELYPEDFEQTKKKEGKSRESRSTKDARERKKKKKAKEKLKIKRVDRGDRKSKERKPKLKSSKRKHLNDSDSESAKQDKKRRKTDSTRRRRKKEHKKAGKNSTEKRRMKDLT